MNHANQLFLATILLIAGAGLVIYLRTKRQPESNIPLMYFIALVAYAAVMGGSIPAWVTYAGLVVALLLRFEFILF